VARGHDLAEERATVALRAHTGNAEARKQLDALNLESAQHASELASLGEAITAAQARLATAKAVAARAQERRDALVLRKAVKRFSDAGHRLDAVLADLSSTAQVLGAALDAVHAAGSPSPSHQQLMSLGERALRTALMATPWRRAFDSVPPGERRSVADLVDVWSGNIERGIAHRLAVLDEQPRQTTEAA
jgi:hypothetical protein